MACVLYGPGYSFSCFNRNLFTGELLSIKDKHLVIRKKVSGVFSITAIVLYWLQLLSKKNIYAITLFNP